MKFKDTWYEKLMRMTLNECLPLGDTPKATVYSAVWSNKEEFKKLGLIFRVKEDEKTKNLYVCRITPVEKTEVPYEEYMAEKFNSTPKKVERVLNDVKRTLLVKEDQEKLIWEIKKTVANY